jgi:hypothetical protein
MSTRSLGLSLIALLIGGCAVGPDYRRPEIDLPGQFVGAPRG